MEDMQKELNLMGAKAVKAARVLAVMDSENKRKLLYAMADAILANADKIKAANAIDMENGKVNGLTPAMLDRLFLNDDRIKGMADGLKIVADEDDPVGKILSETTRPNGLVIRKVSVPMGVIGIIYESRPNVTADAAGICLKAGNTVLLRGGSEAFNSNKIIAEVMNNAGMANGLVDGAVQVLPWTDRQAVNMLVKLDKYVDLIIPRGGEGLIRAVQKEATIPVLKHYKGVCHIFVDKTADLSRALDIIENAKVQRPSACNAVETILLHDDIVAEFMPKLLERLFDKDVTVHAEKALCCFSDKLIETCDDDFYREYLAKELNIKKVSDVSEAIEHINNYGSKHSDAILTEDKINTEIFFANVDSSTVYCNASTRFTDGGEFGMGAEIGISTDKLHARGPMGAKELTIYKYLVSGDGQIR
jgi:glutamate-5-semialdehyde dehydrogenase